MIDVVQEPIDDEQADITYGHPLVFVVWLKAYGTHTLDFLTLPIECRCCTMVEWSQFITFASSRVH